MAKQIFVNLPVKDLKKTVDFFTKLGFTFEPKFTDEHATCMVIGENIFAMLLVEKFFKSFLRNKEICDSKKSTEVLIALSLENRKEVDEMMEKAITAGGREEPRESQESSGMYGRSFEDINGHIWELFFMDMNAFEKAQHPDKTE